VIRALLILAQIYPHNLPAGRYLDAVFDDPVARLDRKLAAGAARLEFREGPLGYLPALLAQLDINPDSQALVFSKTSFQSPRISPRKPRAIYFNDSVAVGFVPGGEVMEVASVDPREGVAFYTLENSRAANPRFARREVCLTCHNGPATLGIPGIFIGSVFPDATGAPARVPAIITDHRTPIADRWGGWYVTHSTLGRSNSVATDPAEPESLHPLPPFRAEQYLAHTSDVVALMTFEHQTHMTNLLTRLNWLARAGAPTGDAIRETVDYMTFSGEAPLRQPIEPVSTFARTFPKRGPLREFDLKTRLFRDPVSYMIYSESFRALPDAVRRQIYSALEQKVPASVLALIP
jgi:hypothetical protein